MAKKEGQTIIIKKVVGGGGHGHHGGAWKVAYADFVTAMMAFFLVMWLMGSDDETKAAIAHYFNHPNTPYEAGRDPDSANIYPMGERPGQGESIMNGLDGQLPDDMVERPVREAKDPLQANRELKELVEEILEGQVYGVDVSIDYMKFSVPESLLFKPGTTEWVAGAPKLLDKLGQMFKGYSGFITVEGHTDNTPEAKGRSGSAYEFSLSRAVKVMNYLVDKNWVAEERMLPVGSGPRRSFAGNDSPEGRRKNRRIEFILSYKREL